MIALWYASRATGLISLILLSLVMVLGVGNSGRVATVHFPRFAVAGLHRNLSLLALAFLIVHVASGIIDPYAGIRWIDAIVPFVSAYHPFWLGLGAVAFDLLLALLVSSLARPRINARLWRAIHWAAYGCWPVAVAHGLGISGQDTGLLWVQAVTGACVAAVVASVLWRTRTRHPDTVARNRPFEETR